ncbi:hypothetical protein [Methylobacterium sp. JK268]
MRPTAQGRPVLRVLWTLLAAAGVACGLADLRLLGASPDAPEIAEAIIRGARLDAGGLGALADRLDRGDGPCQLRRMRHWLIIRSRLAGERLDSGDLDAIDAAWADVDARADAILACFPRDGMGWLSKAWVALQRGGPSEAAFRALRNSYAFAPHEGWLGVRRNRLVLLRYGVLPADLRERALREFADLLASRFVDECVSTFLQADPPLRTLLLGTLDPVPTIWKTKFQQGLQLAEVEVEITGVPVKPPRPWR